MPSSPEGVKPAHGSTPYVAKAERRRSGGGNTYPRNQTPLVNGLPHFAHSRSSCPLHRFVDPAQIPQPPTLGRDPSFLSCFLFHMLSFSQNSPSPSALLRSNPVLFITLCFGIAPHNNPVLLVVTQPAPRSVKQSQPAINAREGGQTPWGTTQAALAERPLMLEKVGQNTEYGSMDPNVGRQRQAWRG